MPFSNLLYRGLPAGSRHDKSNTQTDELMAAAADAVKAARKAGAEMEPDVELGNELYEYVKGAAARLGVDVPPLA